MRAEFQQADAQTTRDYEEAATAMAAKRELSPAEADEAAKLWRKLVKLYHPDRFAHDPEKLASYEKLTAAINHAKDNGDLATLREIANDAEGFVLRQGWARLDFRNAAGADAAAQLRRLWESLEMEIVRMLEAMNELHASAEFELAQLVEKDAGLIETVVTKRVAAIETELADLQAQAERLAAEIGKLTGETPPGAA